jgi:hypothetical protein
MIKKFYILVFLLFSIFLKAQDVHVDSLHFNKSIGFKFDNDIFFQTDYYYTSGISIFFTHPLISKSPISKLFLPSRNRSDKVYHGISILHEMYTPTDTPSDTVKAGDRPYAASLSLNQFQLVENNELGYRITSNFNLGVIGEFAFGEEIQSLIHSITPSEQPVGWENQIRNDILLNYSLRYDKRFFQSNYIEGLGFGTATLGTVNTDLSLGVKFRFGFMDSYFNSFAPQKKSGFKTWLELGYSAKLVAYNAYLQGGMINHTSPYVIPASEIERLIHSLEMHYFIQYNRHRIMFEGYMLSSEFEGAMWHSWGRVSYQYWF